jgi:hypothetical protein
MHYILSTYTNKLSLEKKEQIYIYSIILYITLYYILYIIILYIYYIDYIDYIDYIFIYH